MCKSFVDKKKKQIVNCEFNKFSSIILSKKENTHYFKRMKEKNEGKQKKEPNDMCVNKPFLFIMLYD